MVPRKIHIIIILARAETIWGVFFHSLSLIYVFCLIYRTAHLNVRRRSCIRLDIEEWTMLRREEKATTVHCWHWTGGFREIFLQFTFFQYILTTTTTPQRCSGHQSITARTTTTINRVFWITSYSHSLRFGGNPSIILRSKNVSWAVITLVSIVPIGDVLPGSIPALLLGQGPQP